MCKPFVRYMVEVRAGQCVLGWEEYDLGLPRIEIATALGVRMSRLDGEGGDSKGYCWRRVLKV